MYVWACLCTCHNGEKWNYSSQPAPGRCEKHQSCTTFTLPFLLFLSQGIMERWGWLVTWICSGFLWYIAIWRSCSHGLLYGHAWVHMSTFEYLWVYMHYYSYDHDHDYNYDYNYGYDYGYDYDNEWLPVIPELPFQRVVCIAVHWRIPPIPQYLQ